VIKPVEGTILTVAREAAEAGYNRAMTTEDPAQVMEAVLEEARRTLARTPEMLPVLKQTGVVDAGGQGLVFIYEGMLSALRGEEELLPVSELPDLERLADVAHENAQAKLDPSQIEHGYCTEFIINLKTVRRPTEKFDEALFRKEMERFGDSLLVVADDELVKVHIHAEYPGDALNYAMRYGDLTRIKIDNMREQYDRVTSGHGAKVEPAGQEEAPVKEKKRYGIVAVAAGEGVADIFRSLGADVVIGGGQTMNPSTRDLVQAMEQVHAEHIFILPNNKNIVLAAEQAGQVMNVPVTVVPTRSVPQGLSALFRFDAEAGPEENRQAMLEACAQVKTGEVTYAVRDTVLNGLEIKAGDFLGIAEGKIRVTGKEKNRTAEELLDHLVQGGTDMVTILYGQDVTEAEAKELVQSLESKYPEIEWEVHAGGQPLYYYLFAVE
jgi:DAK2 domain fusion protein YloV